MAENIIVGIDTRDLRIATTGTKTYLEELCKEFKKNNPGFTFHFFDTAFPVYTGSNKFLKFIEHIRFFFWKQLLLPIKAFAGNCDIVFCTDYMVPYMNLGFKTVPVFHDAFFWEYPQHYNKYWLKLFRAMALAAARKSPYIITPSAYTKKQLIFFTNFDESKFCVVYEGAKTFAEVDKDSTDKMITTLINKDYLLHVGSFDKRKNIPVLVRAFKKMKNNGYRNLKLVLAGKSSFKDKSNGTAEILAAIKNNNLQDEVIITGYVSDQQVAALYENAFMYVFPSINEGFGLPLVEAFAKKVPVLVANNTCLPEIGGEAVISFDPFDEDDLFAKIKMVADNEQLRNDLKEKGYARAQYFSWEKSAHEILQIFKKMQCPL